MSHITKAQQGLAAVEAKNWNEAITKLSDALKESQNPAWLIARSKALIGLQRFEEALDDANLAWHTAYERNKRAQLLEAHYRRAVAYFRLKQYANADACCVYAMRLVKGFPAKEPDDPAKQLCEENGFYKVTLDEAKEQTSTDELFKAGALPLQDAKSDGKASEPQVKEWRMASALRLQILTSMEKLPVEDTARKLTISLIPPKKEISDVKTIEKLADTPPVVVRPPAPADAPVRLQDFQSNTMMSVSVFSKGVNKDKLQVTFSPYSAHLDPIIYPNGDEKAFRLDLWGEIEPSESKCTVTPNKVELSLKKKTPGKWSQLKGENRGDEAAVVASASKEQAQSEPKQTTTEEPTPLGAPETVTKDKGKAPATEPTTKKPSGPSYPTSSRSGPKNWDAVADDSDDEDGKDVNHFFKKLFKNATPEQQRAMMKSFTESNGTSLSTDWNDVKDRTVETLPPDGVEAKKWE